MAEQGKLLKQKLDEYFKAEEETEEKVFNQLALYIFSTECKNSDLYILAKLLPHKELMRVINYFDGDILRLPTKEQYMNSLLTSISYYLRVIKKYSWQEVKDFLNLPDNGKSLLSTISIGGKINKLSDQINKDMLDTLKDLDLDKVESFVKEMREETENE